VSAEENSAAVASATPLLAASASPIEMVSATPAISGTPRGLASATPIFSAIPTASSPSVASTVVAAGPPIVFSNLRFIVNANNSEKTLTRNEISDFYFKKNRYWPDGTKVRFFDQRPNTELKKTFVEKVLKRTTRDLDLFWIGEKNFSGQGAPIEAPSDEMIISSVASLPGAIGYISNDGDLDLTGVKIIPVRGP
jgi:hypothetical protein